MATVKAERSIRLLSKSTAELNRISGLPGEIFLDSASQTLRLYDGSTPGGSALAVNAILSDTRPVASVAKNGMLWLDTSTGKLYIYYNDGNSSQWIQPMTPSFSTGGTGGSLTTEQVQDITAGLFSTTHTGVTVSYNDSAATVTLAVTNQSWSQITSKPTFATVATSGSYTDLTNKPTIPTNTNQLTNGAGFITSLGTISYNDLTNKPTIPTNTNQLTNGAGFLTSVGTISYTDLTNKPTIPAAYSATSINALSDVDTATAAPAANQPLVWNAGSSTWVPGSVPSLTTLSGVIITSPTSGQVLKYNGSSWINDVDATSGGAGVGTVTNVSVTSANGFAGTVATASSTPAITITTSITGVLKGNGTAVLAAVSGTDYAPGTSALATGIVKSTTTTGALTIAVAGTDYQSPIGTINGLVKGNGANALIAAVAGTDYQTAQSVTGIVKSSGTTRSAATSGTDYAPGTSALATGIVKSTTTTGALTIAVAGTDYQIPITLTTTGSSGAATFSGGTLNIPQYSGGGAEADTLSTVTGRGATTATAVSITNATAATTATSGALIVTGGVGVGGSIYTGGTLYGTATTFNIAPTPGAATGFPGKSITISSGAAPDTGVDAGVITLQGGAGSTNSIAGNINIIGGDCSGFAGQGGTITLTAGLSGATGVNGKVLIDRTTASTSTTTGALVVSGGVGVAGAIYAGNIYSNGVQLAAGVTAFSGLTDATSAGLTVDEIYLPAITRLVVTTPVFNYNIDQYSGDNPAIYVISGTTIAFNLQQGGSHPFLLQTNTGSWANITTANVIHVSTSGVVSTGSAAQAQVTGTLYWKIPASVSGTFRYICQNHPTMVGTITVKDIATI